MGALLAEVFKCWSGKHLSGRCGWICFCGRQGDGPFQIPSRPAFHVLVFLFPLLCHLELLLLRGSSGLWDFHVSSMTFRMLMGNFVVVLDL